MKIQLDTENKTIKLESEVELSKLVETLEELLPDGKWREFTLQTNTTITRWDYPVIIRERTLTPWYDQPWYVRSDRGTWSDGSLKTEVTEPKGTYALKAGVFNIET